MSRKAVDRLIDNYAQEQGVASAIDVIKLACHNYEHEWKVSRGMQWIPGLSSSILNALTAAGFSVVRTEDIERISATWGPSLDEASPADLPIYDRLRDALAEGGDNAI